jgi:hypothetical protein
VFGFKYRLTVVSKKGASLSFFFFPLPLVHGELVEPQGKGDKGG